MFRKLICITLCLALLALTACTPTIPPAADPAPPTEAPAATDAPAAETPAPEATEEPAPTEEPFNDAMVSDLLVQTEEFSVGLLQTLKSANTEGNTLFSPVAFNAAMAALYAAADGDTEEEIRTFMHYKTEPADVIGATEHLLAAVTVPEDAAELHPPYFTIANSLHLTQRVKFSEPWLTEAAAPLKLNAQTQNFSDISTFAGINKAVNADCGGRLDTDALLTATAAADTLYLFSGFDLSEAYFDQGFDANSVKGDFESPTGLTPVTMMRGDFLAGYAEDEYMQMVSLPMNEGALQLKLILPREGNLSAFDEAMIQYAESWLSPETVEEHSISLTLPNFTLSSEQSYIELLPYMGLNTALRAQTVNLTGMLDPALILPTPINDVYSVGSLSITYSGINPVADFPTAPVGAPSEESIELTFDRPFMLAVTDTHTGALLVMGWVNQAGTGR